ncbi:MAG: TolC family protein [Rhodospirillales bacterium]|nr:TolC family protein [Rhodospirillales bacterium]
MTAGRGFARASGWTAALLVAGAALVSAPFARAETLAEVLPDLLKVSKKVKAAEADMAAANEKAREALGDWFPKLDLTGNYGYERQFKGNNTLDTSAPPREFEMKITQLLWDFGSANRAIDNARLSYEQARSARDATEQVVILEGVVAYLDLMRRTKILEFSRGSEDNIKRQTELEDARVQRGSGFSTDVLQSKRQLAGAQAARARAEGALQVARNRYLNVFDKLPEKPATMAMPRLPLDLLPPSLNEVVDIAGRENPQLKAAKMSTEIARNNVSKTFSDKFAPTINLVGEHSHKNDFDGTLGTKNERMVKVEGKYSFNLGLTAINTLKASEFALTSAENKYGETLDNVQEQARNAWQELDTSKQNLEHLRNESNIAAEFLELARKERALGRRSLIDVLAGETALINASSDATSAETDMAISVFKLLTSMGRLDIGAVKP